MSADAAYQERLLRFIENHDEPRAAATFASGPARTAAVVASTVPGARLFHDGQFDGHRVHIPVFLARGPAEAPDEDLRACYASLLGAVADSAPATNLPPKASTSPSTDGTRISWLRAGHGLVHVCARHDCSLCWRRHSSSAAPPART